MHTNEDSDQPAHLWNLIKIFTRLILDSQGCNQTVRKSSCDLIKVRINTEGGPRSLVDRRVDCQSFRVPTTVVRASLGSHVGKPSSAYGWSGGFCPGSPVFFDERSARYKLNILERSVTPPPPRPFPPPPPQKKKKQQQKKTKKKKKQKKKKQKNPRHNIPEDIISLRIKSGRTYSMLWLETWIKEKKMLMLTFL